MDKVELKMDSKGRICLPPDIREEMEDTVIATRTPKGILIKPGRRRGFIRAHFLRPNRWLGVMQL